MTAENVQDLFEGLENNGLIDDYSHVLTGNLMREICDNRAYN